MNLRDQLRENWDRVAGWALVVAGTLILILGWQGVSNQLYPAAQLPYVLSGGLGGICAIALGATLLVSADLRDHWHKLDELTAEVARLADAESSGTGLAAG